MSLQTWRDEFYPVPVEEWVEEMVALHGEDWNGQANVIDRKAVRHCLTKWRGLLPEAMRKHGVWQWFDEEAEAYLPSIEDREELFDIDSDSCALCAVYLVRGERCDGCPLKEVLGFCCDDARGPYLDFYDNGEAGPMVAALTQALERIEAR